jgi:lysophospholipase L1-like esterase
MIRPLRLLFASSFMLFCALAQGRTGGTDSLPLEKTRQLPDGQIVFSASDGKLEAEGSAHGRWDETKGAVVLSGSGKTEVSWSYKPTRWGMYELEVIAGSENRGGVPIEVQIAGHNLSARVPASAADPDHPLDLGRVHLSKAEPFSVQLRKAAEGAVLLKALVLRPAPEGRPIVQSDPTITLRAADAITHSVTLRYEAVTNKNCLGYWTNPNDTAEWKFQVRTPGRYEIQLWQGCGKGQGGSDVLVQLIGHGKALQEARFTVEDTGHFQNFIPRNLGAVDFDHPGEYALLIRPQRKQAGAIMDVRQVLLLPQAAASQEKLEMSPALKTVLQSRRVAFLGDSITYAGEYVDLVELFVRTTHPESKVEFINLGLPSETVSGLTEPGHAGGAFPRPDLHERLGRVLEKAKPDLIFACYGMNDGIYYPFSEDRFQKFKDGIIRLRERAQAAGVKVVHLTPPTFDPLPLKGRTLPAGLEEYRSPYEGYNEVLDRYSEWLLQQRANGWEVIDVHGPMNRFLAEKRAKNPTFILAGDGVHANSQGHWLIAREVLRDLGAPSALISPETPVALLQLSPRAPEILKIVRQRQRLLKDAWLTEIGHLRPGMNKGKPLAEAQREAEKLGGNQ